MDLIAPLAFGLWTMLLGAWLLSGTRSHRVIGFMCALGGLLLGVVNALIFSR